MPDPTTAPVDGQQQAAPPPQTTTAPPQARPGERMVYGVDGKEPVPQSEFVKSNMDPMLLQQHAAQTKAAQEPKQPAGPAAPQTVNEADYWKQKALEYQQKYSRVAQYDGIIHALETDPALVTTMQRAIAGDIVDSEANEGDDFEKALSGKRTPPRSDGGEAGSQTHADPVKAAEERGRRIAQAEMELNLAIKEMQEGGATEAETHAFLEFVKSPTAPTAKELLLLYRARSGQAQPQQKVQPAPNKHLPPPPVATAGGQTDRPTAQRFVAADGVGRGNFVPGDPNIL